MYNFYPPYAPGAAIIFSKEAVHKFYYASFFVKHFAIDDVYLGIIAKKLELLPVHNPHFYAWYPNREIQLHKPYLSHYRNALIGYSIL